MLKGTEELHACRGVAIDRGWLPELHHIAVGSLTHSHEVVVDAGEIIDYLLALDDIDAHFVAFTACVDGLAGALGMFEV